MAQDQVPTTGMTLPDTSAQQATAAGGVDYLSKLRDQKYESDSRVIGLMKIAATPVPVSSVTPPQLAIQPQPRFQPQPLNRTPVVGHHNAKVQGIGNLITAATNVVGQYEQKAKDEKNRVLAVDIEHIYSAMDGIQQAQEVLQQDPNNEQAKTTLQKNQSIIDAMMSDPKKRKQIAAAFDINFVDPSKNDKPEHQAMQMATKSYAQQLQDKLPQQMQPNKQAAAQLQIEMERNKQLETNIYQQQKIQELNNLRGIQQQNADEKERHNKATEQNAYEKRLQQKQEFTDKLAQQWKTASLNTNTRIHVARIAAQSHIDGVQKAVDGRLAAIHELQSSPTVTIKALQKNLEDQTKLATWLPQAINMDAQLLKSGQITKKDYEDLVNPLKTQLEATQADIEETRGQISVMSEQIKDSTSDDSDKNAGGDQNARPKSKPTSSSNSTVPVQSKPAGQVQDPAKSETAESSNAGDSDTDPDHYH